VRFDVERQEPVRGADSFCIECEPDEAGEVIGKILKDASKPGARFEGYAATAETEKKIPHDAFQKGDIWFRTGDLMRRTTTAISISSIASATPSAGKARTSRPPVETIEAFDEALEANVCSVAVPGRDGRAGMAAIVARTISTSPPFTTIWRSGCRTCAAGVSAHPRPYRRHRHLQAEEARPGGAGF
jgi:fatty-acyl-CoA synthase